MTCRCCTPPPAFVEMSAGSNVVVRAWWSEGIGRYVPVRDLPRSDLSALIARLLPRYAHGAEHPGSPLNSLLTEAGQRRSS